MNERELSSTFPRKADDLEITEVVDGYVVYQPARDRVHYLNYTALLVLELCGGEHDAAQITAFVQQAFELGEAPHAEVDACLSQLRKEELIT